MAASICNAAFRTVNRMPWQRLKVCHRKLPYLNNSSTASIQNVSEVDVEQLFIRKDVQDILTRVTGFDLDKVFPVAPSSGKEEMKIELMTEAEVEKMNRGSQQRGQERLQMPPFLKPRQDDAIVLSENPEIANYNEHKLVFTDISLGLSEKARSMVVRETNGTLRLAKPAERDRILQIYFPRPGRSMHVPQMFQDEHLERLLKEGEYIYVLERACVQFEPDDPKFIEVSKRTFNFIENQQHFEMLRSTRHFGSMTFHLILERRIDALLAHCLRQKRLSDAADLVRLFCIVHANSKCAQSARSKKVNADDKRLIRAYIDYDAREPGPIELALKVYVEEMMSPLDKKLLRKT